MQSFTLCHYAFSLGTALALLSGCGVSQPPIDMRGTDVGLSYTGSGTALLYVTGRVQTMYSYPAMKKLGVLSPATGGYGQGCPDDVTGNIYFPTNVSGQIVLLQFPYGATSASARLSPPQSYEVGSCSADPTSGNLAVTIYKEGSSSGGYIAIYSPGTTQPQTYNDPDLTSYGYCTYDGQGNLFFISQTTSQKPVLAEMTVGSHAFTTYSLMLNANITSLQWDGTYVTAETSGRRHAKTLPSIYRVAAVGASEVVVGVTKLKGAYGGIWIEGKTALSGRFGAKGKPAGDMGYYTYPKGGKPYNLFSKLKDQYIHTFAILSAPQSPF